MGTGGSYQIAVPEELGEPPGLSHSLCSAIHDADLAALHKQAGAIYAGKRIAKSASRVKGRWAWSLADPDAP
jgi:hypothetical protein